MVKVWAEKERRNLVRLQAAGIRSPQPLQLRSHVLIMDFIGTDGVAAPRLKVNTGDATHLVIGTAECLATATTWDATVSTVQLNNEQARYSSLQGVLTKVLKCKHSVHHGAHYPGSASCHSSDVQIAARAAT